MVFTFDKGDTGPSLGRAFGSALKPIADQFSERFKEEYDRGRLKTGLEELNKKMSNRETRLTPLEYNAELLTIPGMTDESFKTMSKFHSQSLKSNYYRVGPDTNKDGNVDPEEVDKIEKPVSQGQGIKKYLDQSGNIQPYVEPTLDEYKQQVRDIISQHGVQAEDAEEIINKENEKNRNLASSLQSNSDILRSNIERSLKSRLQKEKLQDAWKDISGDIQEKVFIKSRNKWLNNQSLDLSILADDATEELLDITRDKNTFLKNTGKLIKKKSDIESSVNKLSEDYSEYNGLEELTDEFESDTKISRGLASKWAYSSKENPEFIKALPKKILSTGPFDSRSAEKYLQYITLDNSLISMAYQLKDKGYDGEGFLKLAEDAWNNGEIQLSKSQQRELKQPLGGGAENILYDTWYNTDFRFGR